MAGGIFASVFPRAIFSEMGRRSNANFPTKSDVIISTRWQHKNSIDTIRAFGATRCEWLYSEDRSFVAALHKHLNHVGLAISSAVKTSNDAGAAKTIDGSVVIAPWMKKLNVPWNSSIHEATRYAIFEKADSALKAGANSIQVDDPALEFGSIEFSGGDFSPDSLTGFDRYLDQLPENSAAKQLYSSSDGIKGWVLKNADDNPIDWRAFNKKNLNNPIWLKWREYHRNRVRQFLLDFRAHLQKKDNAIALSFNVPNPYPTWENSFLLEIPDYLFSEITTKDYADLAVFCASAAAKSKMLVASIVPVSLELTRSQIAYIYGMGEIALVPWDVYVPDMPRYFGSIAEYGDIFRFIRQKRKLLEGFDLVADVAIFVDPLKLNVVDLRQAVRALQKNNISFRMLIKSEGGIPEGASGFRNAPVTIVSINVDVKEIKIFYPSAKIVLYPELITEDHDVTRIALSTNKYAALVRVNPFLGKIALHIVRLAEVSESSITEKNTLELRLSSASGLSLSDEAVCHRLGGESTIQSLRVKSSKEAILPLEDVGEWAIFELKMNKGNGKWD